VKFRAEMCGGMIDRVKLLHIDVDSIDNGATDVCIVATQRMAADGSIKTE
jgi:hypothetical protein